MYKQLYRPDHHRADVTGMVPEHVLVAEEKLGRKLCNGELVHHKNFDKLNNELDNLLFPLTRREHQQLPAYQARFILHKNLYGEFLVWWKQEQLKDEADSEMLELRRKLTRAQNERARIQRRASNG